MDGINRKTSAKNQSKHYSIFLKSDKLNKIGALQR
jgi:hypothetical protein